MLTFCKTNKKHLVVVKCVKIQHAVLIEFKYMKYIFHKFVPNDMSMKHTEKLFENKTSPFLPYSYKKNVLAIHETQREKMFYDKY